MNSRIVPLELRRNDVALLIGALEDVIEAYKYDGGLILCEDELRVRDFLSETLKAHDLAWRDQLTLSTKGSGT